MKKTIFESLCLLFMFCLPFLSVQRVSAHGDEPRIEISAERLNPGSVLDIRGVDFEFEEEVTLSLVGPQVEVPLGTVIADTEGVFLLTIALPVDLTEGIYVIHASTDDHMLDSPHITVWGTADLGGGEEGPREEEDGLLAPIPTAVLNVPTPLLQSALPVESQPDPRASMPYLWIAAVLGIVLLLGFLIKVKR